MNKSGFTLIELMVAMVVGLTAITSVYSLGSAMSQQFFEEQRTATTQGSSRAAMMELRRDISRAGLFGSPAANLESTCDSIIPVLQKYGGGTSPIGAFQYYADTDKSLLNPSENTWVHGDRLRVLTSLYLTDELLVDSISPEGTHIILDNSNQAYRRTFLWGQTAGPFVGGQEAPDYLDGSLGWDSAWALETASWKGVGQQGARAFQTGSVLHIETPEGRHFFRTSFGKADNTQNQMRILVDPPLPVGTACLPGQGGGSNIAPLQWVEYALVTPSSVSTDFMDFDEVFFLDLESSLTAGAVGTLREEGNVLLVRRILEPNTGNVRQGTTQVLAEFVADFQVSFLLDTDSGKAIGPSITDFASALTGTSDEDTINDNPNQVRSVHIDLGIRSPLEDPSIPYSNSGSISTRFEVNAAEKGSARVRHMRIEIPVMSVARRNL